MDRLRGKTAIVSGAGRGIGAAIAQAFCTEGAFVVVAEIDQVTGNKIARQLNDIGPGAAFFKTDVTDKLSIKHCIDQTIKSRDRIDILINNAGVNVFNTPHDTSDEEWQRCMAVDLDGVWQMSKAVLPHMRAQKSGAIVNIASSHSFSIIPHTFPYPVAKHGVLGLTRSLGVEYANENIRVNAIAPGYIETELAEKYWATFDEPDVEKRRIYDMHPPGRIGRPEEVAMTAVFLASDEAPFINASCINVDGGKSVVYHE